MVKMNKQNEWFDTQLGANGYIFLNEPIYVDYRNLKSIVKKNYYDIKDNHNEYFKFYQLNSFKHYCGALEGLNGNSDNWMDITNNNLEFLFPIECDLERKNYWVFLFAAKDCTKHGQEYLKYLIDNDKTSGYIAETMYRDHLNFSYNFLKQKNRTR